MASLSRIAYLLALIGGILLILFGLLGLLGSVFLIFSPIAFLSRTVYSVIQIVIGFFCIIGSKFVTRPVWAIILLVLGILGGGLGGSLVVLGALMGLAVIFLKIEKI